MASRELDGPRVDNVGLPWGRKIRRSLLGHFHGGYQDPSHPSAYVHNVEPLISVSAPKTKPPSPLSFQSSFLLQGTVSNPARCTAQSSPKPPRAIQSGALLQMALSPLLDGFSKSRWRRYEVQMRKPTDKSPSCSGKSLCKQRHGNTKVGIYAKTSAVGQSKQSRGQDRQAGTHNPYLGL